MTTKLQRAAEIHETMAAIHAHPKPTKERKPKRVPVEKRRKLDPDQWFSLCVRERAGWKCECCGSGIQRTMVVSCHPYGHELEACDNCHGHGVVKA